MAYIINSKPIILVLWCYCVLFTILFVVVGEMNNQLRSDLKSIEQMEFVIGTYRHKLENINEPILLPHNIPILSIMDSYLESPHKTYEDNHITLSLMLSSVYYHFTPNNNFKNIQVRTLNLHKSPFVPEMWTDSTFYSKMWPTSIEVLHLHNMKLDWMTSFDFNSYKKLTEIKLESCTNFQYVKQIQVSYPHIKFTYL